jgi:hypothetical protein
MQIHPGARAALRLLTGDELDVAEMVRDGDLVSPSPIGNLYMFRLRVSGVGYAYRPKLDEYVYRRPENYLTPRFLKRCNGLFVVWEHPERAVLNSEEFAKRIIGNSFVPYIADRDGNCVDSDGSQSEGLDPITAMNREVWTVAKIQDRDAVEEMTNGQLSTSPSVVFRDPAVNFRHELEDGSTLLVEGPASLLDHLAVCQNGVWDKSEEPTGVGRDVRLDETADIVEAGLTDAALDAIMAMADQLEAQLDALAA